MVKNLQFFIARLLYRHSFPVYWCTYSLYKRVTDRKERQIIREFIAPGMVVLDVGSNIGVYALFFSNLVGESGRVYCFEPSRENFRQLQRLTSGRNNITVNNLAVGNVTGKLTLYISNTCNVDHRTYPVDQYGKTDIVNSIRLDDYGLPDGRVDFIKIDIQGYEYDAFLGMENTLKNNPHVKIMSEFWPYGLRKAGKNPEDLIALIHSYGFHVFLIDHHRGLTEFSFNKVESAAAPEAFYNLFCVKTALL